MIEKEHLGVERQVLQRYMFEEYCFNNSTQKIVPCGVDDGVPCCVDDGVTKPLFATLVLILFLLYIRFVLWTKILKAANVSMCCV